MRLFARNAPNENGPAVPQQGRQTNAPRAPWLWCAGCFVVLLLPLIALVVFDAVATRIGSNALDRQLQVFKSHGRRLSSVGSMPACAPAENGLPLWKQIRDAYHASNRAADAMSIRASRKWSRLTDADKQAMREHFAANTQAISLMQEAASRPFFTFVPDYTKPMIEWYYPSLLGLTKIVRALVLYRGRLALEDRNTSDAVACVALGAETARSFARLPMYISAMLARLTLKSTVELGELALPGNSVPDALAERIMNASDPAIYRKSLADGLENERISCLEMTTACIAQNSLFTRPANPMLDYVPVSPDDAFEGLKKVAITRLTRPVAALDGATVQNVLAEYADLALKEPWETAEARKKLVARIDAIPSWHFFAHAVLPRIAPQSSTEDTLVRAQIMRTALGCKRYGSAHDSLPDSLEQLVPQYLKDVPSDPYTGKQMTYVRPAAGGFVLYSVGPNAKDDTKAQLESGTLETSKTRSNSKQSDDFIWVEPATQK